MKKILLTGGSGFVGRNIIPLLKREFDVSAPSRQELELRDTGAVERFIKSGGYDVIVHCANPNPAKNGKEDSQSHMVSDSLRVFMNFYRMSSFYEKMIYLGSGAEFDKSKDICNVGEEEVHNSIPYDDYGMAKYVMNSLAAQSKNIYNFRLFGCYGPLDHESKFITHCIRCCLRNEPVTIRQNCMFDYLHVYDVAKIIAEASKKELAHHDYNLASGHRVSLENIARGVIRQMKTHSEIVFLGEGWNREYTADIGRLEKEFHMQRDFISLEKGIEMQIAHEKEYYR